MNNKKYLALLISIIFVLMLISVPFMTACSTTPSATQTLKIGASVPLSGPPSAAGIAFKAGWELGFDTVNNAGGIKVGNTSYKVQMMTEDSKGSTEGATTVATKLCLQEGVKFLMGDIADFLFPPLYAVTSKAGALFFLSLPMNSGDVPGSMAEVSKDRPLLIRGNYASSEIDILTAQYLAKNYPNAKNVAFIALMFPDYDAYKDIATAKWAPLGLKITTFERITPDDIDFVPLVSRLLATKPDAIDIMRSAMGQLPMLIKTIRDQGFNGPIMYAMPADISYTALAGPNTTDVFGTGLYMDAPNLPQTLKDAIAKGRAKMGKDFVADSLISYDQSLILAQMIEKAQSIDPEAVLKKFETLTNPGELKSIFGACRVGGLKLTGVNRVLTKPCPLSRMMNGKPELLGFFDVEVP